MLIVGVDCWCKVWCHTFTIVYSSHVLNMVDSQDIFKKLTRGIKFNRDKQPVELRPTKVWKYKFSLYCLDQVFKDDNEGDQYGKRRRLVSSALDFFGDTVLTIDNGEKEVGIADDTGSVTALLGKRSKSHCGMCIFKCINLKANL